MMKRYGLIGFPLGHSFSKRYFSDKFEKEGISDAEYGLYPITAISDVSSLIASNPSLRGLNITIPHKIAILPLLDELDAASADIGAVNCIRIDVLDGKTSLKGFNTDAIGFERSLQPLLQPYHQRALILGTGGAAKAVAYVLKKLAIPFLSVSRKNGDLSYDLLTPEILASHQLIINTTPLGMHPDEDAMPDLPMDNLGRDHLVYDLIYNPEQTKLLKLASLQGAATKNGLDMLILQAEASWEIWNNNITNFN